MKKLITILLITLVICLMATPCLAATVSGDKNHNVYAQYRYFSDENSRTASLLNDAYEIIINNGIKITVTPSSPSSELTLVIHFISPSETEAYKWFADCTKDFGDKIIPFDIYFIDKNGNRTNITASNKISITLPDGVNTPMVISLSAEGKTTVLESSISSDKINFKTDSNSYYVIAEKVSSTTNSTSKPIVYGDANNDGKVNLQDVLLIKQYNAEWNVTVDSIAADANLDKKINSKDVLLIKRYNAEWNVVLGTAKA